MQNDIRPVDTSTPNLYGFFIFSYVCHYMTRKQHIENGAVGYRAGRVIVILSDVKLKTNE